MNIQLFDKPENCCGCLACMNACPRGAISTFVDENGYVFPKIDNALCVGCGECVRSCGFKDDFERSKPLKAYAAATRDKNDIKKSSSGGIFAALARKILAEGGAVFGSALQRDDDGFLVARHICVETENELPALQGSKYVQSDIGKCYSEAKKIAESGRTVLFSGTPCQISGFKTYLKKPYDNVYTVDIICHGTPAAEFFKGFQKHYCEKNDCTISDYSFRDKAKGQGKIQSFTATYKNGSSKKISISGDLCAYVGEFQRSSICRESCYNCKFASLERTSDITLGDYWGVYEEHSEELRGSDMNNTKGISCVLVNTEKGEGLLSSLGDKLETIASTPEKIAKHNDQLRSPAKKPLCREAVLERFKTAGYAAMEKGYKKDMGIKLIYYRVLGLVPRSVKNKLQALLK